MNAKLLVCAVSLCATSALHAGEPAAEELIKYRQAVMSSIGSHMGAASSILRSQVSYQHLPQQVSALVAMLGIASDVFPAASASGETEALPVIWEQPDAFAKAMNTAQTAARELEGAMAGGDPAAIGAAFRNLGGSCRGCHDDFRKPQS